MQDFTAQHVSFCFSESHPGFTCITQKWMKKTGVVTAINGTYASQTSMQTIMHI